MARSTVRSTVAKERSTGVIDRLTWSSSRLVPIDQAGRLRTRIGRPAGRPKDAFCSPFKVRTPFLFLGRIQSGFPKSLRLSGYKYGLEPSCIVSLEVSLWYSLVLIVESIKLSLPCPEDVGKMPNLVEYYVGLFSLLFICSDRVGTSPLHLSLLVDFSLVIASHATTSTQY